MDVTVERFVTPYGRESKGKQKITFSSSDIEEVRFAQPSPWIEEELITIIFSNGDPSIIVGRATFFNLIKELEERPDDTGTD